MIRTVIGIANAIAGQDQRPQGVVEAELDDH